MNPTAFVTGAPQGIGLATVERLLRDGLCVVAVDRSAAALRSAVERLQAQGAAVRGVTLDICDRAPVAAALDAEPRIDAMVCVAAISRQTPLLAIGDDEFRQMMDVNVLGTFIPAREARRGGCNPAPASSPCRRAPRMAAPASPTAWPRRLT